MLPLILQTPVSTLPVQLKLLSGLFLPVLGYRCIPVFPDDTLFLFFLKLYVYMSLTVSVYISTPHSCSTGRSQKRALKPLEPGLQVAISWSMWVLGTAS